METKEDEEENEVRMEKKEMNKQRKEVMMADEEGKMIVKKMVKKYKKKDDGLIKMELKEEIKAVDNEGKKGWDEGQRSDDDGKGALGDKWRRE